VFAWRPVQPPFSVSVVSGSAPDKFIVWTWHRTSRIEDGKVTEYRSCHHRFVRSQRSRRSPEPASVELTPHIYSGTVLIATRPYKDRIAHWIQSKQKRYTRCLRIKWPVRGSAAAPRDRSASPNLCWFVRVLRIPGMLGLHRLGGSSPGDFTCRPELAIDHLRQIARCSGIRSRRQVNDCEKAPEHGRQNPS
jgi:hypothetical protein